MRNDSKWILTCKNGKCIIQELNSGSQGPQEALNKINFTKHLRQESNTGGKGQHMRSKENKKTHARQNRTEVRTVEGANGKAQSF